MKNLFRASLLLCVLALAFAASHLRHEASLAPVERDVRDFVVAARDGDDQTEKLGAALGADAIPYLLDASTNIPLSFRQKLYRFTDEVSPTLEPLLDPLLSSPFGIDSACGAIWRVLNRLARTPAGAAALAARLNAPGADTDWLARQRQFSIQNTLRLAVASGYAPAFAALTNALARQTNASQSAWLAMTILGADRTNATALSALQGARTGTDTNAASLANRYFENAAANR